MNSPSGPERILRICFYAALGAAALTGLLLIPVRWSGLLAVRMIPLPHLSDVLQNAALAFQGHSNGYSRAFRGYFVFIFMAGAFLSAGRWILDLISRPMNGNGGFLEICTGRERYAYDFLAGSLAFSLLWLGLGLSGFLSLPVAYAAGFIGWTPAIAGLVSGRWSIKPLLARWTGRTRGEKIFIVFLAAALAFLSSGAALYPIGPDSLGSHGALANFYAEQGRVVFTPHHVYSYLTQNTEMLLMWTLLLGSDFAAQLLIWGFFAAWIVLAWGFLDRHFGSLPSMAAAAMLVAIPAVSRSVVELKNDAPACFLLFAHYACLAEALRRSPESGEDGGKWFLLSGLAAGGAFGHKMLGLPLGMISFLALAADAGVRRRKGLPFRNFAVPFVLAALPPALPWLIRTWAETGNPVYPFFQRTFPYPHPEALKFTAVEYFYDLLFGFPRAHAGMADSIRQLPDFKPFWGNIYRPTWGPSVLFGLLIAPCLFLSRARGFRTVWIAALLSYLFLYARSYEYRLHMGPLVFLVVTLFAFSWREVLERSIDKIHRWFPATVAALAVLTSNVWAASQPSFFLLLSGFAPGNYYSTGFPVHDLFWMAHVFNTRSAPGDSVLLAGIPDSYPFRRRNLFTGRMDPDQLGALTERAPTPEALKEALRQLGVNHLIISNSFSKRAGLPPAREKIVLERLGAMLAGYMRVVYVLPDGSMTWYVFREDAGPDKIVWDARDAELFPGDFIGEAKALRASGNEAEARRLLEMALPVPMMAIHKDEVKRLLNETERK